MVDRDVDKESARGDVEIRFVDSWPEKDIVELYRAGGWWKDHYDTGGIGPLIENTYAFAVAVDVESGRAMGMGRIISDGVSDAYIQDIVVLAGYRGRGIGKSILGKLVEECERKKFVWIGLIAEEGTEDFYAPLGFKRFKGRPMVYQPGEK